MVAKSVLLTPRTSRTRVTSSGLNWTTSGVAPYLSPYVADANLYLLNPPGADVDSYSLDGYNWQDSGNNYIGVDPANSTFVSWTIRSWVRAVDNGGTSDSARIDMYSAQVGLTKTNLFQADKNVSIGSSWVEIVEFRGTLPVNFTWTEFVNALKAGTAAAGFMITFLAKLRSTNNLAPDCDCNAMQLEVNWTEPDPPSGLIWEF